MRQARAALDVETGGGEVLATVERPPPPLLVATESWPTQRRGGTAATATAGCPCRRRRGRAGTALRSALVRPRGQPPPGRRAVGRDRPGPAARRDLPVTADRRRHERGAHRLHDGAATAQPGPQRRARPHRGRAGRPRGAPSCGRVRSAWSSSTSPRSCTSCARCPGPSRVSRPTAYAEPLRRLHAHIAREGSFVSTARRMLVEAVRPE